MKASTIVTLVIVVLLLNAGITLMLINAKSSPVQTGSAALVNAAKNERDTQITAAVKAVEEAVVSVNVTKVEVFNRGFRGFGFFDFF